MSGTTNGAVSGTQRAARCIVLMAVAALVSGCYGVYREGRPLDDDERAELIELREELQPRSLLVFVDGPEAMRETLQDVGLRTGSWPREATDPDPVWPYVLVERERRVADVNVTLPTLSLGLIPSFGESDPQVRVRFIDARGGTALETRGQVEGSVVVGALGLLLAPLPRWSGFLWSPLATVPLDERTAARLALEVARRIAEERSYP